MVVVEGACVVVGAAVVVVALGSRGVGAGVGADVAAAKLARTEAMATGGKRAMPEVSLPDVKLSLSACGGNKDMPPPKLSYSGIVLFLA